MNPTRALIEAAEDILESYDLLIDAAVNHFNNPRLAGVIRGTFFKIESFRAAISSAKAAEEGVETLKLVEPTIQREPVISVREKERL